MKFCLLDLSVLPPHPQFLCKILRRLSGKNLLVAFGSLFPWSTGVPVAWAYPEKAVSGILDVLDHEKEGVTSFLLRYPEDIAPGISSALQSANGNMNLHRSIVEDCCHDFFSLVPGDHDLFILSDLFTQQMAEDQCRKNLMDAGFSVRFKTGLEDFANDSGLNVLYGVNGALKWYHGIMEQGNAAWQRIRDMRERFHLWGKGSQISGDLKHLAEDIQVLQKNLESRSSEISRVFWENWLDVWARSLVASLREEMYLIKSKGV